MTKDGWEYDVIEDEDMKSHLDRIYLRRKEYDFHRTKDALRKFTEFMELHSIESYEEVDVDDIENYIDYLHKQDLADSSIKKVYLPQVTRFLKKKGVFEEGIHDRLDTEHLNTESIASQNSVDDLHHVKKDEYDKMLEAAESLREELILRLLWETGVRRKEAVSIKLSHLTREKNEIWIDNLKNDKDREVYYTSHLARKLREWLDMGGRKQYSKAEKSDYLLVSNQSEQLQDKYINELVKDVAKRADVAEKIGEDALGRELWKPTAHSFRHAFAVHRVKNGMPVNFLKDLMGHKSVETTEFYLNFKDKDIREINERYAPRVSSP
jgi:integrase/recombinase XerD